MNQYQGHLVVRQIRHLIAHRALPRIRMIPGQHREERATPVMDRKQLLEDKKLKLPLRQVLDELPSDDISVSGLVRDDGRFVLGFVDWFAQILALHEIENLGPVGRLIAQRDELRNRLAER